MIKGSFQSSKSVVHPLVVGSIVAIEIGDLDPLEFGVDVSTHVLQIHSVLLHFSELLLHRRKTFHGRSDFVDEASFGAVQRLSNYLKVVHFGAMLHGNHFFLLSFFFPLLSLNDFSLSLGLLLILSLDNCDSLVQPCQKVGKFRVNFIDQVREIGACFIVNTLEEHH